MSKRQIISSFATVFTLALVTARVAVWVFPLESSAQEVRWDQSIGVTVDTQGRKLLHGSRIEYPRAAREKHIEGTVFLQLSLNARGEVADARVESGPDELRSAALSSALQWHFANESGQPATIQASLSFKIPPSGAADISKVRIPALSRPTTLGKITFTNMPDNLAESVRSRLPLRAGDQLTTESLQSAADALRAIDEHLSIGLIADSSDNSTTAIITLAGTAPAVAQGSNFNPPPTDGVKRIRVGGNVQSAKLVVQPRPLYPTLAKQARIQGTVRYNTLIGADGFIRNLELVAGHPLLVEAAMAVVPKWQYQPTLLNGEPAEVITVIDVNFTLTQ
jgi:TonB family protein